MTYIESFQLANKHRKLLKIVNFYERQIDVLDKMLDEFASKYASCASSAEKREFHKAFEEKQIMVSDLKQHIKNNDYLLSKEVQQKEGRIETLLLQDEEHIEKDVMKFEREVNELSREFREYLITKI